MERKEMPYKWIDDHTKAMNPPRQLNPSPKNPLEHSHENFPSKFLQLAFLWQTGSSIKHSLTSGVVQSHRMKQVNISVIIRW